MTPGSPESRPSDGEPGPADGAVGAGRGPTVSALVGSSFEAPIRSLAEHPYLPPPTEQHDVPWRDLQQATRIGAMLVVAAGLFYLTFLWDRAHENVPILWILTLIAETIVILHTLGIWMTMLAHRSDIPEPEAVAVMRRELLTGAHVTPTVDVFICHATEPLHLVLPTMIAAQEMQLPHTTWVLDDGRDNQLRAACARLGIGYIRRQNNAHAKAGNVNSAIDRTYGEFIVILDADHVPRPDMLVQALPHLITNPSIAMVQTPQTYDFEGRGMIAEGAAVSQEVFYEALMPAKNLSNAAFCVGTNVVFRRRALETLTTREPTWKEKRQARKEDEASGETPTRVYRTLLGEEYPRGGIWVGSNSEDIWTSLELHRRGWRTVFLPKVLTQGLTPDTITAFLKQQFRWACGGWEMIVMGKVLRDHRLTPSQKFQYMQVPSHYAQSFSVVIFAILSPAYLLLDRSPIRANFADWAIHFVPFYFLSIMVPFIQAGKFRPSSVVVSLAAAPAHLRAFVTTARKQKTAWSVTNSRQGGFKLRLLTPHLFIGVLDVLSLVVALELTDQDPTAKALACCWVLLQLLLIGYLLAGSERADRIAARDAEVEPSGDGALELLESYLALRRRPFTPTVVLRPSASNPLAATGHGSVDLEPASARGIEEYDVRAHDHPGVMA